MQKAVPPSLSLAIRKSQARFKRIRIKGPDQGTGEFFFLLDIAAATDTYLPLSIASGKKSTGFVYHIEGTGKGTLVATDISVTGRGVTQVTLGTILYTKIPKNVVASFRMLIEMKGVIGKEYGVAINQINYKHTPSDARYQKLPVVIYSKRIKFV